MNTQVVELFRLSNRKCDTILSQHYTRFAEFIFSRIRAKKSGEITLYQLIEDAERELAAEYNCSVSWYLLKVKQDLEARGDIKISIDAGLTQFIHINTRVKRDYSHSVIKRISSTR